MIQGEEGTEEGLVARARIQTRDVVQSLSLSLWLRAVEFNKARTKRISRLLSM